MPRKADCEEFSHLPADRTFDMASTRSTQRLMGDAVDPRKWFIQTHARSVRNLDI